MNNNPQETETSDFIDAIKGNPFVQYLLDNRRYLPYAFIALFILLVIAYRFTGGKASEAESSYLLAENYFTNLQQSLRTDAGLENVSDYLEKLKELTAAYPSLQSRYDGMIAQLLIAMDKPEEADEFASRTLQRTEQDQLPLFNDFSRTTLMIAKGNLQEALTKAKALKKEIIHKQTNNKKATEPFASLFAYTLLRIAMLESKGGTSEGEKKGWADWKKYADSRQDPQLGAAFATIERTLKEGGFSLNQYISLRESVLFDKKN